MRLLYLLAIALSVTACNQSPATAPVTRPDWRGATIDGIAPLMSPADVQAALDQRGYRQIPCLSTDRLLPDPLQQKGSLPCFQAPGRPMTISLYFLDLNEGRRLAVVNFRQRPSSDETKDQQMAANRAFVQRLRHQFGTPSHVEGSSSSSSQIYWFRPGGRASLPDMISTKIHPYAGANVELTSMWAYGQVRSSEPAAQ